ncbi:MAG: hypothetical protein BGO69_18195 [Bacteroidetes bacterium 46-16]|nr:MAG: hypothetical protein BGO69_18195 [Bacteroidetes bacterium 46-16]
MKIREAAYKYYFYFMQERMNMFWKKNVDSISKYTDDPILAKHKFTNVYRASDRVSQYLIKNVIYNSENVFDEKDVILRIIIFKIFNKIETWEYLENKLGAVSVKSFDVDKLSQVLSERRITEPIFSAAYMMTGIHERYSQYTSKHESWLRMVKQEIINEKRIDKIIKAKSLEEVYKILRECAFIGDFLAFQYAVDLNYSTVIDFDENSFVKAGIGAIRGIKKCFIEIGKFSFEDCIKYTQDNLSRYQEEFGYTGFENLWGREPKLIDLQNCFCETDKYLRVKLPELQVDNTRIKQKFTTSKGPIDFYFPPKWNINHYLQKCNTKNTEGLTLF